MDRDSLWKGILEEVFDDLLRFVFPNADELFDLQRRPVYLDKEFATLSPEPGKRRGTCLADKLVQVYSRDGRKEFMLIHLEVQGQATSDFAERMFRYYCRIFDRWRKPVTAIAIFTAADGHRIPDCYQYNFAGTEIRYKYNVLRIHQFTDDELASNPNPFAAVALVAKKALMREKMTEQGLITQKIALAKYLMDRLDMPKSKLAAIFTFFNNYVAFKKTASERIFMQRIQTIKNKKNVMGILEMLEEDFKLKYRERVIKRHLKKENLFDNDIAFFLDAPLRWFKKFASG